MRDLDFGSDGVEMKEVYWEGANGCEYMTWQGMHQVFIMPSDKYPFPPSQVIQYHKRITSYADFRDALNNGRYLNATYHEIP